MTMYLRCEVHGHYAAYGNHGSCPLCRKSSECADCGSTGHSTGSDTCPGPDVQDKLDDPNRVAV